MAWPEWPWPPQILRQIYDTGCLASRSESRPDSWLKKVVCCKTRIFVFFLSCRQLGYWSSFSGSESAKGQTTATSQTRDLPLCHRTKVSPSGLFPSERHKPCGPFVLGIAAPEGRYTLPVFTGRVHGPCRKSIVVQCFFPTRPVNTGSVYRASPCWRSTDQSEFSCNFSLSR